MGLRPSMALPLDPKYQSISSRMSVILTLDYLKVTFINGYSF